MPGIKPKVIVVLGPNASGKSALAVDLAHKWNGEVISADSRQVYKGLDIGTGKITKREMHGVRHHLLDVVPPQKTFSVTQYQKLAHKALKDILRWGKLPIICGGTGLYIDALLYSSAFPAVPPNAELRRKLEKESVEQLFTRLQKLDPRRAANIDRWNKRRLVRALEIVLQTGRPVPEVKKECGYDVLKIGIRLPEKILIKRIHRRLLARMRQGMVAESVSLHRRGLSWKRMEEMGLEYRYLARYLQCKIDKKELAKSIESKNWRYAKRQMTWFKRDKTIRWIQKPGGAEKIVRTFLSS